MADDSSEPVIYEPESAPVEQRVVVDGMYAQQEVAVRVLESDEFATLPDAEALDVALQLQRLARGVDSILGRMEQLGSDQAALNETVTLLKKQAVERDAELQKYESNRQAWFDEQAAKLAEVDPQVRAQAQASAAQQVQAMRAEIAAGRSMERMKFKQQLQEMPLEEVLSAGVPTLTPGGMIVIPEEVRIKDRVWRLPPGEKVRVPQVVAERLRARQREMDETQERMRVLDANHIQSDRAVSEAMRRIDSKYGTPGESISARSID